MPIYEFYCRECNTIFNFFSKTVNIEKRPLCPKCNKIELSRQISKFSMVKGEREETENGMPDIDESKMEQAMGLLASEAGNINEDDPKKTAKFMRKFTDMTGINLGSRMDEAIRRMEAGEEPERIEAEMGDLLDEEEPFTFENKAGKGPKRRVPERDETLYEL